PPPKVPAGLRYGFTPPVPLADLLNRRLPGQVGVEVHPRTVLNGFLSESAVGVGHGTISGLSVCSDTRRPRRRASVSAVLPGRTWIESREPALRYGAGIVPIIPFGDRLRFGLRHDDLALGVERFLRPPLFMG